MKKAGLLVYLLLLYIVNVQAQSKIENVILITTDGLRWQEVFQGMDPVLANDRAFNQGDSADIYKAFWAADAVERRSKLMPFFWSTISTSGQLYGNRAYGNKVNNANPHWFSYPGYSEILTGYGDEKINSNDFPPNPHITVLEFLHKQPAYKNKIAVFGAWDAFDRIVNEQRSGIPVISAFDPVGGSKPTPTEQLINQMQKDVFKPWDLHECLDVFTHFAAMENLKVRKPKVMQISYGETDEWAHAGMYKNYLNAAHMVDKWIGDIWNYVQSDPHYKNKTAIIITTDHGRGDKVKEEWKHHGSKIVGADEIWIAVLAPGIPAKGEVKQPVQLYQQQVAQTVAKFLGQTYTATHPIAPAVKEIWEK
ncbi:alkaline phosphatase family protein [Flavihumibacter sp. RY-1]|uniref:Alkaline phosphatase family protein n=1 Tax=Flavihumibacter fluminis TaxID=2909236 RepID=A0ABS9BIP1_9BACT|nr:alkaline phosphatase family protein [Flavihumibacter fluminis]MCF1715573.1 alkaline phosphatase family protein [Flavihumibacter fluminis]